MKKIIAALLAAAMAVTCLPQAAIAETLPQEEIFAAGDTGKYQDFEYEELEDGTISITEYSGSDTEIVIPSEIDGKKVTVIGDQAFYNHSSLTEITIPDSVTTIGDRAFNLCYSLTQITIPYGVTIIGVGAFSECYSLAKINVDENNKNFSSIDGVLFNKDATALIQFPSGKGVTSYVVPDGVTTIGESAFEDVHSLTEINLPDSVTTIEGWAFADCDSLTEINFPDGLTIIGDFAFFDCDLTKIILPDSVTTIGEYAFGRCFSLEEITLSDGLTTIGNSAFETCFALTEINIPDSVTKIGDLAFDCCFALTKITIPASVTEIGVDAFNGCDLTIYGYTGSYAETYAKENNINFVSIVKIATGDVNNDGEVGELDSVELARYLANWNVTIDKDAADLDGDGEVGETDSVILARRLAGWNV